jgi:hypothetical protein
LDDLEELDDARVLPALDRADFDGLATGIPPFLTWASTVAGLRVRIRSCSDIGWLILERISRAFLSQGEV